MLINSQSFLTVTNVQFKIQAWAKFPNLKEKVELWNYKYSKQDHAVSPPRKTAASQYSQSYNVCLSWLPGQNIMGVAEASGPLLHYTTCSQTLSIITTLGLWCTQMDKWVYMSRIRHSTTARSTWQQLDLWCCSTKNKGGHCPSILACHEICGAQWAIYSPRLHSNQSHSAWASIALASPLEISKARRVDYWHDCQLSVWECFPQIYLWNSKAVLVVKDAHWIAEVWCYFWYAQPADSSCQLTDVFKSFGLWGHWKLRTRSQG